MKNKSNLRGLKSVYSFTLRQTMKSKSNIVSMVVLFVMVLISFPLQSLTGNSISVSPIQTAYVANESGTKLDFDALTAQNAALSSVLFETADFDKASYADYLGESDVYVYIGTPDKSNTCTIESHTIENSSLKTEDLESLLTAISSQLTAARLSSLGLSAQSSYDVDSMSASDYLDQKNGTERIGFDASFAIQYGYSIVVMTLCLLAASFIIRCIVTEKDSKLIELLMVSVSPFALLLGKILAIMTYVLILIAMMVIGFILSYGISTQFLQMASLTATLSQMGIDFSLLNLNWGSIVIALISLLLAFATYAVLSGLIGTCCNTMEQAEPAIMIVTLLIMIGYITSCFTPIISSNAVAAAVLSLCPVISVFCAPVSYVCGNISLIVLIFSWIIQAIILAALSVFCAKIYRDLLLYRGSRMGISVLFGIFKKNKKEGAAL